MKTGIELIAKERQEQIEKHGFEAKDDAKYTNKELVKAAKFMLTQFPLDYPDWDRWLMEKSKSMSRIKQLTVAGALIAAEIDRLQAQVKGGDQ